MTLNGDGNTQGLESAVLAVAQAIQAKQNPTTWLDAPLNTGWSGWDSGGSGAYGRPQYRKDANGMVHLRGLAKNLTGAVSTAGVPFNLPAGFRPSCLLRVGVLMDDLAKEIDIKDNGDFIISGTASVSNNGWISFNNVHYFADQ